MSASRTPRTAPGHHLRPHEHVTARTARDDQCGAGTGLHAVFTLNRWPATSRSFIEGRHGIKFPPTQRFADTGTAAVEKRAEHGSNVLRWVSTAINLFDGANRSAARL